MVSLKSRKQKRCSPNYIDSGHREKIETGSLCYFNSMPIYGTLVYSKYWPTQVGRYQKQEKNLFSILKVFITKVIQNKIKVLKVINFYSKYRLRLKDNSLFIWL